MHSDSQTVPFPKRPMLTAAAVQRSDTQTEGVAMQSNSSVQQHDMSLRQDARRLCSSSTPQPSLPTHSAAPLCSEPISSDVQDWSCFENCGCIHQYNGAVQNAGGYCDCLCLRPTLATHHAPSRTKASRCLLPLFYASMIAGCMPLKRVLRSGTRHLSTTNWYVADSMVISKYPLLQLSSAFVVYLV